MIAYEYALLKLSNLGQSVTALVLPNHVLQGIF